MILTYCMFHERTSVVHVRVDYLSTSPFLLSEWFFIYMHDLIPSSHKVVLVKCFMQVWNCVADNILYSNMRIID